MDLILLSVYLLTNICISLGGMTPKTIIISSETSRWLHQSATPTLKGHVTQTTSSVVETTPHVIVTTATEAQQSRTKSSQFSSISTLSTSAHQILPSKSTTYQLKSTQQTDSMSDIRSVSSVHRQSDSSVAGISESTTTGSKLVTDVISRTEPRKTNSADVSSEDRSTESSSSVSGFEILMASNFSTSEIADWFEAGGGGMFKSESGGISEDTDGHDGASRNSFERTIIKLSTNNSPSIETASMKTDQTDHLGDVTIFDDESEYSKQSRGQSSSSISANIRAKVVLTDSELHSKSLSSTLQAAVHSSVINKIESKSVESSSVNSILTLDKKASSDLESRSSVGRDLKSGRYFSSYTESSTLSPDLSVSQSDVVVEVKSPSLALHSSMTTLKVSSSSQGFNQVTRTTFQDYEDTTETTYRILTIPELMRLNRMSFTSSKAHSEVTLPIQSALSLSSSVDTDYGFEERTESGSVSFISSDGNPVMVSNKLADSDAKPQLFTAELETHLTTSTYSFNISPTKTARGTMPSREKPSSKQFRFREYSMSGDVSLMSDLGRSRKYSENVPSYVSTETSKMSSEASKTVSIPSSEQYSENVPSHVSTEKSKMSSEMFNTVSMPSSEQYSETVPSYVSPENSKMSEVGRTGKYSENVPSYLSTENSKMTSEVFENDPAYVSTAKSTMSSEISNTVSMPSSEQYSDVDLSSDLESYEEIIEDTGSALKRQTNAPITSGSIPSQSPSSSYEQSSQSTVETFLQLPSISISIKLSNRKKSFANVSSFMSNPSATMRTTHTNLANERLSSISTHDFEISAVQDNKYSTPLSKSFEAHQQDFSLVTAQIMNTHPPLTSSSSLKPYITASKTSDSNIRDVSFSAQAPVISTVSLSISEHELYPLDSDSHYRSTENYESKTSLTITHAYQSGKNTEHFSLNQVSSRIAGDSPLGESDGSMLSKLSQASHPYQTASAYESGLIHGYRISSVVASTDMFPSQNPTVSSDVYMQSSSGSYTSDMQTQTPDLFDTFLESKWDTGYTRGMVTDESQEGYSLVNLGKTFDYEKTWILSTSVHMSTHDHLLASETEILSIFKHEVNNSDMVTGTEQNINMSQDFIKKASSLTSPSTNVHNLKGSSETATMATRSSADQKTQIYETSDSFFGEALVESSDIVPDTSVLSEFSRASTTFSAVSRIPESGEMSETNLNSYESENHVSSSRSRLNTISPSTRVHSTQSAPVLYNASVKVTSVPLDTVRSSSVDSVYPTSSIHETRTVSIDHFMVRNSELKSSAKTTDSNQTSTESLHKTSESESVSVVQTPYIPSHILSSEMDVISTTISKLRSTMLYEVSPSFSGDQFVPSEFPSTVTQFSDDYTTPVPAVTSKTVLNSAESQNYVSRSRFRLNTISPPTSVHLTESTLAVHTSSVTMNVSSTTMDTVTSSAADRVYPTTSFHETGTLSLDDVLTENESRYSAYATGEINQTSIESLHETSKLVSISSDTSWYTKSHIVSSEKDVMSDTFDRTESTVLFEDSLSPTSPLYVENTAYRATTYETSTSKPEGDDNISDYILKWVFDPKGQDINSKEFIAKVIKGLEITYEIGVKRQKNIRFRRETDSSRDVNIQIHNTKTLADGTVELEFSVSRKGVPIKATDAAVVFNEVSLEELDDNTGVQSVGNTGITPLQKVSRDELNTSSDIHVNTDSIPKTDGPDDSAKISGTTSKLRNVDRTRSHTSIVVSKSDDAIILEPSSRLSVEDMDETTMQSIDGTAFISASTYTGTPFHDLVTTSETTTWKSSQLFSESSLITSKGLPSASLTNYPTLYYTDSSKTHHDLLSNVWDPTDISASFSSIQYTSFKSNEEMILLPTTQYSSITANSASSERFLLMNYTLSSQHSAMSSSRSRFPNAPAARDHRDTSSFVHSASVSMSLSDLLSDTLSVSGSQYNELSVPSLTSVSAAISTESGSYTPGELRSISSQVWNTEGSSVSESNVVTSSRISLNMDTFTALSDGSQMDTFTASLDSSQMDKFTASSDSSQMDTFTASSDSSQMDTFTASSDSGPMDTFTASSDSSQMDKFTASSQSSQMDTFTASSESSQIDLNTLTLSPTTSFTHTFSADKSGSVLSHTMRRSRVSLSPSTSLSTTSVFLSTAEKTDKITSSGMVNDLTSLFLYSGISTQILYAQSSSVIDHTIDQSASETTQSTSVLISVPYGTSSEPILNTPLHISPDQVGTITSSVITATRVPLPVSATTHNITYSFFSASGTDTLLKSYMTESIDPPASASKLSFLFQDLYSSVSTMSSDQIGVYSDTESSEFESIDISSTIYSGYHPSDYLWTSSSDLLARDSLSEQTTMMLTSVTTKSEISDGTPSVNDITQMTTSYTRTVIEDELTHGLPLTSFDTMDYLSTSTVVSSISSDRHEIITQLMSSEVSSSTQLQPVGHSGLLDSSLLTPKISMLQSGTSMYTSVVSNPSTQLPNSLFESSLLTLNSSRISQSGSEKITSIESRSSTQSISSTIVPPTQRSIFYNSLSEIETSGPAKSTNVDTMSADLLSSEPTSYMTSNNMDAITDIPIPVATSVSFTSSLPLVLSSFVDETSKYGLSQVTFMSTFTPSETLQSVSTTHPASPSSSVPPSTTSATESTTPPSEPPDESLMILTMKIAHGINISSPAFTEQLEKDLTTLYNVALEQRQKRDVQSKHLRFRRQSGVDAEVVSSERDPNVGVKVTTTFAVTDGGEYVDADVAVPIFNRIGEKQSSAILSHEVLGPITAAQTSEQPPPVDNSTSFLIIVAIVVPATLLLLGILFIIARMRRRRGVNAVGDLPPRYQRGETLEDHNLTVDVEKGEIVDKTPTSTPSLVHRSSVCTERKVPLIGGVCALGVGDDDERQDTDKYRDLTETAYPEEVMLVEQEKGSHRNLILKEKELLEKLGVHDVQKTAEPTDDLTLELPKRTRSRKTKGAGGPSGYSTVGSECPLLSSSGSMTTVSSIDSDVHTDASDEFTVIIRNTQSPKIREKHSKEESTPENVTSVGVQASSPEIPSLPLTSVGVQATDTSSTKTDTTTRTVDTQTSKDSSVTSDSDLSSPDEKKEGTVSIVVDKADTLSKKENKMVQTPWATKRRSDTRDIYIDDDDLRSPNTPVNTRLSISAGSGETAQFLFPVTESLTRAYNLAIQRSERDGASPEPQELISEETEQPNQTIAVEQQIPDSPSISSTDSDSDQTLSSDHISLEDDSFEDAILAMGPLQMAQQSEVTTSWSRKCSGQSFKYPAVEEGEPPREYMQMFPSASSVIPVATTRGAPRPKPRNVALKQNVMKKEDLVAQIKQEAIAEEVEAAERKDETTRRAQKLLDQTHALGCAPDLQSLSPSDMMERIREELKQSEASVSPTHVQRSSSQQSKSDSVVPKTRTKHSVSFVPTSKPDSSNTSASLCSGSSGSSSGPSGCDTTDSTAALLELVRGELQRIDSKGSKQKPDIPRAKSRKKGKHSSKS